MLLALICKCKEKFSFEMNENGSLFLFCTENRSSHTYNHPLGQKKYSRFSSMPRNPAKQSFKALSILYQLFVNFDCPHLRNFEQKKRRETTNEE